MSCPICSISCAALSRCADSARNRAAGGRACLGGRDWDRSKCASLRQNHGGKIIGLDPALEVHRLARKRIAQTGPDVDLVGLSAEEIPLDDASFDCVVVTYTLCSVPTR
jgi:methyltransferase family protein